MLKDELVEPASVKAKKILGELEEGLRESYSDVRELLLHFRTRTNTEDIETAIRTTLQKFEHQSGIHSELDVSGQGLPLAPDVQIQVMHVIQEALSNIRKHSKAGNVRVLVKQSPSWEFQVIDDGIGFEAGEDLIDSTHVGLSIMKERAMKIGAHLEVEANKPNGAKISLTLPA